MWGGCKACYVQARHKDQTFVKQTVCYLAPYKFWTRAGSVPF
jgi:hypothetical protein